MPPAEDTWFNHERLEVYRDAIAFVVWLSEIQDGLAKAGDVRDQLDRASNSIVLNIAEGTASTTRRIAAASSTPPTVQHSSAPAVWISSWPRAG